MDTTIAATIASKMKGRFDVGREVGGSNGRLTRATAGDGGAAFGLSLAVTSAVLQRSSGVRSRQC